jgi:hypothetical protein
VDLTDPVLREFERSTALAAFQTLPQRWQFVLWHLEVEGLEVADVAVLLDLTASATASLAYRAREGLRQAYLTCHALSTPPQGHSCRLTSDRLASYIRGGLSSDRQDQVGAHLAWCRSCCAAYRELTDINTTLRAVAGAAATTAPSRSVGGITSAAV